jgi:hypothetical protein
MNAIPNRRGLLLGALTAGAAASVAAISPITAADPPDPVFALLEAHKAAWRIRLTTTIRLRRLAEPWTLPSTRSPTPPTTVAGMRAVMEYLVGLDGHMDYLPTLLRSSILRSPLLATV